MMMIYKATNGYNGMAYIGYTDKTLDAIAHWHNTRATQPAISPGVPELVEFHQAIKEYTPDSFVWECLHEAETITPNDWRKVINDHGTNQDGYNAPYRPKPANRRTTTAIAVKPRTSRSPRKKKAKKRAPRSKETKLKISQAMKGRPKSEAHKQAISDGHATHKETGLYYQDPEYKKKQSEATKGKIHRTPEQRAKYKEAILTRWYGSYRGGGY